MPWNCLCSVKEKRKLDISAPILNTEDTQNLQLIPLTKYNQAYSTRSSTSYKFKRTQKPVLDVHSQETSSLICNGHDNGSNNLQNVKVKNIKTSKKKSFKLVDKLQLNGKPGKSLTKRNEDVNKQLATVKFSFEDGKKILKEPPINCKIFSDAFTSEESKQNCDIVKTNENVTSVDVERVKQNNDGNYDEIPPQLVSFAENTPSGTSEVNDNNNSINALCNSSESIPFIDDEADKLPKASQPVVEDDHSARFITLHPKNGSVRTKPEHKIRYLQMSSFHAPARLKSTSVDDIDNKAYIANVGANVGANHEFLLWTPHSNEKMCQVCHETLLLKASFAVKCQCCDLICHDLCVKLLPSIRYHDTSLIIFRKWLKAHEKLAFPTLYHYLYNKREISNYDDAEHHLTDSELTNSSGKYYRNDDDEVNKQKPIRRIRSLEKRKRPEVLVDISYNGTDDQNNNALNNETVKLHIVESNNNLIHENKKEKHKINLIVADVHRPNSQVHVINENINTKDTTAPEDLIDTISQDSSSSSNANTITSVNESEPKKQSQRNSNSSNELSVESLNEDVLDYATIDLRKATQRTKPSQQGFFSKPQDENVFKYQSIPKSQSFPIHSKQNRQSSNVLRLHYVTQRILASVLPSREPGEPRPHSEEQSGLQEREEQEVISMLEQKHGKNYRVFDLESCISVITLERICELCKRIDSWLGSGQEKVVVLQDRNDRQRLGTTIAAYLEYLDICSSNLGQRNGTSNEDIMAQNSITRNWLDLDMFSMKKFLEDFIGPLLIPSHRRYLRYFSGLLSGKIKMNSSPLFVKTISVESPPSWLQFNGLSSSNSEWTSFIKIYEGLRCIYTSDLHIVPITTRNFLYQIGSLRLRGDILIRCYQVISQFDNNFNRERRELLFSLQFHTCAITTKEANFGKDDLDFACDDGRFPSDHRITLHFEKNGISENGLIFQSPLIRTESPSTLAKYDSLEELDPNSSCHTQGPLDGSLYATILKSPKSPQPIVTNSFLKKRESQTNNLISPPPQFSNTKYELLKRPISSSTPIREGIQNHYSEIQTNSILKNRKIPTSTSTDFNNYRSSSQHSYRTTFGNNHHYPSNSIKPGTYDGHNNINGGRESVRSPLTLSIDSGISSSGQPNRQLQGSSVSPSSLPSQISPQEDRHRELDDILTDMLMTVQDIPDFGKVNNINSKKLIRSQSTIPTSSKSNQNYFSQYKDSEIFEYDTIKRSPSSMSHVNNNNVILSTNLYSTKDRDHYDTSSTTTTLTPPPSESGRNTPLTVAYTNNTNNNIATLHHRHNQNTESSSYTINNNQQQQQHDHDRNNIMSTEHHQSSVYTPEVRTESVIVSEDEENIPYHAREHSQPFTYGNVLANSSRPISPTGTSRMIKMQSGLSSPSLVRKTLAPSTQTHRKILPRNDFEEMLRERRDKVMSEKYSISDKTPGIDNRKTFDSPSTNDGKWVANGYHNYNEPLKRSNTMDGGFGRSNSTDGLSGQTWLQLQQQKLRAKKDQQIKDDRRYFDEVIQTEIRNRPLKSRPNASQRFDGYTSDNAAFADEVDFQRPLHVQTPYSANRSPERTTYYTIAATKTVHKERPFVAVKRSHEVLKRNLTGSPPLLPFSVLNASPNGFITQAQSQDGLLSMAGSPPNGHIRLESENSISLPAEHNPIICTSPSLSFNNNNNHCSNNSTNHYNHELINNNHENGIMHNHTSGHNPNEITLTSIAACGHLALDRLLASLAVESSLMDQQLEIYNNNNITSDELLNSSKKENPKIENLTAFNFDNIKDENFNHQNNNCITNIKSNCKLTDMIADLTEYSRFEELKNMNLINGTTDNINTNSPGNSDSPCNSNNRRLLTESDNSSSISPSLSDQSNPVVLWHDQAREESFSSYRSETDPELSVASSPRPETPAFPVTPRTPYAISNNGSISPALPPKSPTIQRKDLYSGSQRSQQHEIVNQNDIMSCYTSRRNSNTSNSNSEPQEVAPHHVKFVRDSSKYWYKPNITREEAVTLLRNAQPGTFLVRDSTTFKNAFGLVLRVAHPPPGVTAKGPPEDELVRHFLVEPTSRGVRLKGCVNEPVFTSLSALVYQHSITQLALPCKLVIPEKDIQALEHTAAQKQLLSQGAACNVLYLFTSETESLTGDEAVRKAVSELYACKPLPSSTEVHFKVSHQGITLTDNTRQKFFRKHYTANAISFCGLDPEKRLWSIRAPEGQIPVNNKTIFGFVARRSASSSDNQCHVFCDLSSSQPAMAIVSFANKVLPIEKDLNYHI